MQQHQIQQAVEGVVKSFPFWDYGLHLDPNHDDAEWTTHLAMRVAKVIAHDLQQISESVQMGQDGEISYSAIQFTGENPQVVKDFLGAFYEGMRGGVRENDPPTIWFSIGAATSTGSSFTSSVKPTEWVIKFTDAGGFTRLDALTHDSYQRLYGR